MKRDFLALNQYTKDELDGLFALTKELKAKQKQGIEHHLLKGKSVALIFEKSSTRTRVSFEVGVYQLGAHPLFISSATSQMGRGEPIRDTARVMSRYCDGVMIRTYGQEIVRSSPTTPRSQSSTASPTSSTPARSWPTSSRSWNTKGPTRG